jgi:hypothetical protein
MDPDAQATNELTPELTRESPVRGNTLLAAFAFYPMLALCIASCDRIHPSEQESTPTALYEGASFGDEKDQQQFKDALARENVRFTLEQREGKEFVRWNTSDHAAAQRAQESLHGGLLPVGRHLSVDPEQRQEEFEDWLRANSIPFQIQTSYGREYVVWGAGDTSRVEQWPHWHPLPSSLAASSVGR